MFERGVGRRSKTKSAGFSAGARGVLYDELLLRSQLAALFAACLAL
jgi:hypothetical protein